MIPDLTVIIPAKNEEKSVCNLLRSLGRQTYKMYDVPIYLADAGSTDGTVELATETASRLRLSGFKVIPGGLPAVGRNAGAKLASNQYLLFLDADVELRDSEFVANAVTVMQSKKLHCMTTDILCPQGNWKSKVAYGIVNVCQRCSRFVGIPFATGMCMFFERGEFVKLGGFREDALFAEDYMLTKQVGWNRFRVLSGGVATSDRRMRKMGYWKLAKLFFGTALLGHRDSQFTKDHGYWHI